MNPNLPSVRFTEELARPHVPQSRLAIAKPQADIADQDQPVAAVAENRNPEAIAGPQWVAERQPLPIAVALVGVSLFLASQTHHSRLVYS